MEGAMSVPFPFKVRDVPTLASVKPPITLVVPSAFKKSKPPNFVPSRRVTFEVKDRLLVSALPPSSLPPTFNESVSTVIVPVLTVAASLVAPVVSPAPPPA